MDERLTLHWDPERSIAERSNVPGVSPPSPSSRSCWSGLSPWPSTRRASSSGPGSSCLLQINGGIGSLPTEPLEVFNPLDILSTAPFGA